VVLTGALLSEVVGCVVAALVPLVEDAARDILLLAVSLDFTDGPGAAMVVELGED